MGYIYKITNLINGKEYIGKTEATIIDRFKDHIKDSRREKCKDKPLYRAFNKYGIDNFIVEEVERCSDEILNERESYWIDYYNTYHYGYNATRGGDGKSYIDYDEIFKLYNEGNNLADIGRKTGHDAEWISKILKGRGISSQEIKEKSQQKYEKQVFQKDKKTNKILQVFPSVAKAAKWVKENNLSKDKPDGISSHICQCCNGKRKSAYQFNWSYEE